MAISAIAPFNGNNLTGNLAQNTAAAPTGPNAAINNTAGARAAAAPTPPPAFTVSLGSVTATTPTANPAAPTPPPAFTVSLGSVTATTPTASPAVAPPVLISPPLDAVSLALVNLRAVESIGVLQANENLARGLFGPTNPGAPPGALFSTPSEVQAVQPANPTEHDPVRTLYFLTSYFKMMNMSITGSVVNITV